MRYSMIAAALVGAVAASPAWSPPAYGGEEPAVDVTTVVTVTSCAATVTDCPGNAPTGYPVTTSLAAVPSAPVEYPSEAPPAETPYSPVESAPPVYDAPSAAPPASTPYSPEQPPVSAPVESIPPPAYTPVDSAPPAAETPYSPVGSSPAAPVPAPSGYPSVPAYPVPGNGTYGSPSGTATGAPSASVEYPVQQTGNTAAGLKAGSFLAGCGAIAALLL